MKKVIAAALIAALTLSFAAGCSDKKDGNDNNNNVSSVAVAYDSDGCVTLLDGIMHYERDTSGSSLKAVAVAVKILNWTEENQADRKTISATVKNYLDKLSDENKVNFKKNFDIIDEYADDIVDGDKYVLEMISDSGAKMNFRSYSEKKYEVFSEAVEDNIETIKLNSSSSNISAFDKEDCMEVMRDIANIDPGSSGSSLRALDAAAELIDFIADCRKCTEDEIKNGVTESYNSLDADTKKKFNSNIKEAMDYVNRIMENTSLLDNIGEDVDMEYFVSKKYDAFIAAIEAETGLKLS